MEHEVRQQHYTMIEQDLKKKIGMLNWRMSDLQDDNKALHENIENSESTNGAKWHHRIITSSKKSGR